MPILGTEYQTVKSNLLLRVTGMLKILRAVSVGDEPGAASEATLHC